MKGRYRALRVKVKRYLQQEQRQRPWMNRLLSSKVFDEQFWHWRRDSVATGVGWGAACAIAPVPMQSLWGIGACLWRKGNIPMAVLMAWLSPPGSVLVFVPLQWWLGWWIVTTLGFAGSGASLDIVKQALGVPGDASLWDVGSWQIASMTLKPLKELSYLSCLGEFVIGVVVSASVLGFVCYLIVQGLWSMSILIHRRQAVCAEDCQTEDFDETSMHK